MMTRPKYLNYHALLLISSLCLSSCTLLSSTMNQKAFAAIPIGASVEQVKAEAGAPYRIKSEGEVQTYYYIERIQIGPNQDAQHTYLLVVKEGKVIDKRCVN